MKTKNTFPVLTFALLLLACSLVRAQQPQTRDTINIQPLQGINAKWANGVGPGYWPNWVSGLSVSIGAGTCFDSSETKHSYAGGTISVTNATNYIDLKDSDCSIEISTSAYQTRKHLAIIVASAGAVTSIVDDRSWFITPAPVYVLQVNGVTLTAGDTVNFNDTTPAAAVNGLNIKWQKSTASTTDSVSGYVPGDGNSSHCFLGNGTFASCPGTSTIPRAIPFTIYNSAGLASGTTTASYDVVTVPFACTISAYNLVIDAGTITVKFWRKATGTAIPTSSDSISTSGVSISSGTAIHSTTTSDFTSTTVTANDIIAMDITAVTSATIVNGVLQCDESQ